MQEDKDFGKKFWADLANQPFRADPETKREAFWRGFWSVFSHPVMTYVFGLTAGLTICKLLGG